MIRIRSNLQAHAVHDNDGILYYDVTDPQTSNTVRLYDIEWELASQLQGEISMAALQQWAQTTYGYTPTPADLTIFFQHLRSFGWEQEPTNAFLATPVPTPTISVPPAPITPAEKKHDVQPNPSEEAVAIPASPPANSTTSVIIVPPTKTETALPPMSSPVVAPLPPPVVPLPLLQPPREIIPSEQGHASSLLPTHQPLSFVVPSTQTITPTKSWVPLLTLLLLSGIVVLLLVLLFISASRL